MLNATFNNISVKSWRSVLLVKETGAFRENHLPVEHFYNSRFVRKQAREDRNLHKMYISYTNTTKVQTLR